MSYIKKPLEELDVIDDFLMNAVATDPEVGEEFKIDGRYLKSGEVDFRKLPSLYVITITNYDPFGEGYMMYTIHNKCEEVPELLYDDGLRFIYFNTRGTKGGNAAIYNLLKYIQSSKVDNVTDAATQQLHQCVSRVKVQPETRLEYMRFDELMAYAQIEGRTIGMEEGRAEGRAEGRTEGRAEGRTEGILETRRNTIFEFLEEYGDVPETLRDRINNETSEEVLKGWLKIAVKTQSIEEFVLDIE